MAYTFLVCVQLEDTWHILDKSVLRQLEYTFAYLSIQLNALECAIGYHVIDDNFLNPWVQVINCTTVISIAAVCLVAVLIWIPRITFLLSAVLLTCLTELAEPVFMHGNLVCMVHHCLQKNVLWHVPVCSMCDMSLPTFHRHLYVLASAQVRNVSAFMNDACLCVVGFERIFTSWDQRPRYCSWHDYLLVMQYESSNQRTALLHVMAPRAAHEPLNFVLQWLNNQ